MRDRVQCSIGASRRSPSFPATPVHGVVVQISLHRERDKRHARSFNNVCAYGEDNISLSNQPLRDVEV